MRRNYFKQFSLAILVLGFLLIPVKLNPNFLVAAGTSDEGFIRLNTACSQVTECSYRWFRICSTSNGDHKRYRCSAGCEGKGPIEEPTE